MIGVHVLFMFLVCFVAKIASLKYTKLTPILRITKLSANIKNMNPLNSKCKVCFDKQGINCITCNGTGIDKKNGSVFERW